MTDDAFMPNPWIMSVLIIGAGVVARWLAADLERDGNSLGRAGARLGGAMCVVRGAVVLLVVARAT